MITGKQTLVSIDQVMGEARSKIHTVEAQIDRINQKLVDNQKGRTEDYKELARVHLDLLADGGLVQHLEWTDRQVIALLGKRATALEELQLQIQATEAPLQTMEVERAVQALEVDAAAEIVDAAEAKTQARLEADPEYQARREQAEQAERMAMHAQEKAIRSKQEREKKGESYRTDPLFMYLWERNYGLPGYRANGLVRWLDTKVAKLIGFADARLNYSRLNEIPLRLGEHAEHLRVAAEAEFQGLKQTDNSALEADGVPALIKRLAEEQSRLDAIDQQIEQAESAQQALLQRKAVFATGDDEHTRKAVQILAADLQRDDLVELRHAAMTTPFPEDDLIVSRLLQREDERHQLETSIDGLRETIAQHHKRLSEIKALRGDFKRQHYDRSGSTFGNNDLIEIMLEQFLNGALTQKKLWKVLQEQQRYKPQRSNPRFGSGGLGHGTVWSGGAGSLGRGGGVGGGGFSTGGGFGGGGGGFRTGGGF